MKKLLILLGLMGACLLTPAFAKVAQTEADKLGTTLTPVGAEKAGNADGSIPAWTPMPQKGPLSGEFFTMPFDSEKPLFTITKANMGQYAAMLTEGHKLLLGRYPTYKMNVYPSHRVVSFPDFVYEWTKWNATNCELLDVDTPNNCKIGFTYPIPQQGAEVMWNQRVRYRGLAARRWNNQMIVQTDGSFQLTKIMEEAKFYYAVPPDKGAVPLMKDTGLFLKYFSQTVAPPRMAGLLILVHERAGAGAEGRQAWLYSPALKRTRRAPTVCCDNPYEGTDGHQFYDQVDMFNGILARFSWKLLGKKEMILPYNGTKIAGNTIKFADLAKPNHLNQDLPRYEKHRFWVVEATINQGTNHTFHKRVFYVDEDSWYPSAIDNYDGRGQLAELQEGHTIWAPFIQSVGGVPEVIYHFDSGRYFITAMANEDKPNDFSVTFTEDKFEPGNIEKRATK